MKHLSLLTLAFISFNALAIEKDVSLKKFCEITNSKRLLSKEAIKNDGMIQSQEDVYGGTSQTNQEYYRGCRFDTPWIDKMYTTLCHGSNVRAVDNIEDLLGDIRVPESFLFFFDGAGDFDGAKAKFLIKAVNIDGSEGSDIGMGNANGLKALSEMYKQAHALRENKKRIELHYHSGSGFKQRENYASALACAEETKYNIDVLNNIKTNEKSEPKWMAMGFSNGAALTIDFQNDVTKMGIEIDLAISIDPIVQTAIYAFHHLKKTIGIRNLKTKRYVSFYQNTDVLSMPGLKLRGKPVKNADENYLLDSTNSELEADGSYNHLRIVKDRFVFDKTSCEFGKIFGSDKFCRD